MNRWVIFGGAEIYDYNKIKTLIKKDDFIICADGGQRHVQKLNINAGLYIGDFDSSEKPVTECETIILPCEKDDTDTLSAVKEGLRRGCREFLILGGTGGRLDHTFANLQTLLYCTENGAKAVLADEKNRAFVIKDSEIALTEDKNKKISVFAVCSEAHGVTLEGFEYPLDDYDMKTSFPIGVSNSLKGKSGRISVKHGTLLIIISEE